MSQEYVPSSLNLRLSATLKKGPGPSGIGSEGKRDTCSSVFQSLGRCYHPSVFPKKSRRRALSDEALIELHLSSFSMLTHNQFLGNKNTRRRLSRQRWFCNQDDYCLSRRRFSRQKSRRAVMRFHPFAHYTTDRYKRYRQIDWSECNE
jgi:hypothetical protein